MFSLLPGEDLLSAARRFSAFQELGDQRTTDDAAGPSRHGLRRQPMQNATETTGQTSEGRDLDFSHSIDGAVGGAIGPTQGRQGPSFEREGLQPSAACGQPPPEKEGDGHLRRGMGPLRVPNSAGDQGGEQAATFTGKSEASVLPGADNSGDMLKDPGGERD